MVSKYKTVINFNNICFTFAISISYIFQYFYLNFRLRNEFFIVFYDLNTTLLIVFMINAFQRLR